MMNGFEYAGMDMVLASSFRAAIYCRLSKDDDLDGESASIANQRAMLETYCEKQGWEVVAVYQDDGYTGLNICLLYTSSAAPPRSCTPGCWILFSCPA